MRKAVLLIAAIGLVAIGCKNGSKEESNSAKEEIVEVVSELPDHHNSENSLDWAGVYEGTTPCADCEGIKNTLMLDDEGSFELSQVYLGKEETPFVQKGEFVWNEAGSAITLNTSDKSLMFKVGENEVTMLDQEGNVVTGELASSYVLKKM